MVEIRLVKNAAELERIPDLEQAIWGNSDPVPASLMRVMVDHGGGVWVALDGDVWVGFAMALAARDECGWYLHSHQAGILAPYRYRGVGRSLKWAQRTWALHEGYTRIGWTFDPLRAANAHFNLTILGARVTHYFSDYYGVLDSDLNRGLPTDRVFCEWNLATSDFQCGSSAKPSLAIEIPEDIGRLKQEDPAAALAWQQRIRDQLTAYLNPGTSISRFERFPTPRYILT